MLRVISVSFVAVPMVAGAAALWIALTTPTGAILLAVATAAATTMREWMAAALR